VYLKKCGVPVSTHRRASATPQKEMMIYRNVNKVLIVYSKDISECDEMTLYIFNLYFEQCITQLPN